MLIEPPWRVVTAAFFRMFLSFFADYILWTATFFGRQAANVVESPAVRTFDSSNRLFLIFWTMFRRVLVAATPRYAGVHT